MAPKASTGESLKLSSGLGRSGRYPYGGVIRWEKGLLPKISATTSGGFDLLATALVSAQVAPESREPEGSWGRGKAGAGPITNALS